MFKAIQQYQIHVRLHVQGFYLPTTVLNFHPIFEDCTTQEPSPNNAGENIRSPSSLSADIFTNSEYVSDSS